MNVTLSQLRAFEAVSRYGSFTLAATALHRTQPAITVQIRQLEKELGLVLFDRTTRELRLAPAAIELAPVLASLLLQLDKVLEGSQDLRAIRSGTIRIGCLPSIAASYLPAQIAAFRRQHPGISFVLRDELGERLLPLVRGGEVDFAITDLRTHDSELESLPLMKEQMCAFFPEGHPLQNAARADVAELSRHDLILMAHGSNARRIVESAFIASGRPPLPACEASYMATAIGMVEAGLGVALLPALGVNLAAHPQVRSRRLPSAAFTRQIAIVHTRRKTLTPSAEAFLNNLAKSSRLPAVGRSAGAGKGR